MQIKMPSLSCRPRIAGSSNNYAFGDEFSTGDLPRNQPFCQYSPRGSFYPGGLSERARSNWDTLHHQGATTASDILGQKNDGGCPTSSKKKKKKKKKKSKCQSESSNCGVDSIVEEVTAFSSPTRLSVSSMGKTSSDHENVVSVVGVTDDINTGVPKTCVIGSAGDIDLNHDVNDKPRKKRKKKKRKQSESSKCGVDPIMEEVTAFSSPRLSVSSMGKTSSDHENVVPVVGVTDDMNTGVPKTCVIGSAGDIGLNHEVNDKPRKKPKKKKRQCQSESSKCGVDPIMEEVTAFSSSRLSVSSTGKTSSDHENVVSVFGVTGDINTGVPKTCVIGSAGDTDLNHEVNDRPRKKPKKKRKKKPQSKSSEFGVESMTVEVADGSSQSLSNGNLVESTLTSACEKYLTSSANTTMDALGKNTMAEVNVGLSQEANKKPEEPKDEMAGVSIDLKHHISGKVEETKHIVNKCLNSMKEDVTGTSSQGLPIGLGGTSLEQESVVSVDMSTSIPRTDVLKAVLANDHPVESNLMAGVNFELNHDLSGKPEETMHIVKAKSKKRKRKNLPSSSKCGDNTMKEEATDASSQRLSIGSMGGDSLKHESVLSVDMSTSTPRTDVHRAGLTSDHPLESDLMNGVNVELSHDVNGKPEETMHTVQAKSKKRKRKNLPSSSKCGVNSMEKEVTDASSQRLAIGSMGGTSLDHENILSGSAVIDDISKSIPRTEVISAENTMKEEATDASSQRLSIGSMGGDSLKHESVLSVDMSTSTPRTDVHRAGLTSDHPLESDLMTGVNVELNHDVNGKPEERMHTVQAKSKKRKPKNLPSSSTCGVNSMEKEVTDASSQRLAIGSMGGTSLDHENILSGSAVTDDISKSIPRTEFISAENTMKEEATDASSQRLSVGSMGEDSLKQESVLSVDMSTSTPRTDVHRASLTSDHPLESDLMTGVNVELNHDVNGKPKETMHTVQAKSKKRKRKNLPSSSKCGVNSTEKEVADDSSQRLAISSMGGASLDHENILSVSAVTDDISKSIPRTEVISAVTANDHSVDERGKRVVSMTVQNTMKSLPAVPEKGMLCKNADNSSLQVSQPSRNAFLKSRRKLLVLDLNGLLADITADYPRRLEPDFKLSGKGVFVRPFCDDFLQFCFEKFDVGIWSSRAKKNVSTMVDLLMKDTKKNLLFCWNNSHCTGTGFKTIENKDKPIVLKELKKLWEKRGDHLRWKKGFYDESNTVLLDDSPYKALRNPPHTAVFPFPYSFKDVKDKSLGPDGDLRLYLGRLAEAENVQEFIRANPFGQKSITSANISWNMYSKIAGEFAQEENGIASTSTSIDPYLHSRQRISLKAAL